MFSLLKAQYYLSHEVYLSMIYLKGFMHDRHVDPEAAEICFQRFSDITMISWEQTIDADLSWHWYDSVIAPESNKTTKLLRTITRHYEKLSRSPNHYRQFVMCDMVAMAAMLKPELITVHAASSLLILRDACVLFAQLLLLVQYF